MPPSADDIKRLDALGAGDEVADSWVWYLILRCLNQTPTDTFDASQP